MMLIHWNAIIIAPVSYRIVSYRIVSYYNNYDLMNHAFRWMDRIIIITTGTFIYYSYLFSFPLLVRCLLASVLNYYDGDVTSQPAASRDEYDYLDHFSYCVRHQLTGGCLLDRLLPTSPKVVLGGLTDQGELTVDSNRRYTIVTANCPICEIFAGPKI